MTDVLKLTPALRRLTAFDLRNIRGRTKFTPDVLAGLGRLYNLTPHELELALWPELLNVDRLYKLVRVLGGQLSPDDEKAIWNLIEERNAAVSARGK